MLLLPLLLRIPILELRQLLLLITLLLLLTTPPAMVKITVITTVTTACAFIPITSSMISQSNLIPVLRPVLS